jgi:5-methylcytosine-specific restriction protein B
MLTYQEYEKTVFNWLMAKHNLDPNFTFTVRQSAVKGAETDYFIGTEKSNYFGTTFWTLPVSFPGSSSDCINLFFELKKDGYSYYFEFNQTQTPHDLQNQSALNLLKALKEPLQKRFKFKRPFQEANKMYTIQIAAPEKIYGNLELMLSDVDKQLEEIIDLVDGGIENEKKNTPSFKGYRVTKDEFSSLLDRLNKRIERHDSSLANVLSDLGDKITQTYLNILRRLLSDLGLDENSEKIYFNYEKGKLIFGIGQRYVFNVEHNRFFRMISKNKILEDIEEFKSEPKAFLTNYPLNFNIDVYYDELLIGAKETLQVTEKSGFYKFDKKDFRAMAFNLDEYDNNNLIDSIIQHPLNQILYGPPGTGKTYHTINKALEIINDSEVKEIDWLDRKAVKELYQKKVDSGQIVFTTFHQSISYEDFVEGIKPDLEEDKDGVRTVIYDIKDGIFKELCNKARVTQPEENDSKEYFFEDAWNDLLSQIQARQENEKDYILDILTPKKGLKITEITNNGNLRLKPINSDANAPEYTVSYLRLKELHRAIPDLKKVKNIDKEFRAVIGGMNSTAYWSVLNFVNNWMVKANLKKSPKTSLKKAVPHVLIIDEINRGNVSAIFGELITLIEDSKRLGKSEALEITLPYSKSKFGVPENVYIIGTMNTADRSVEALDTALRRRFSFEEMLPNSDLIAPEKMVFDLWCKHSSAEWDDVSWLEEEKNLYSLLGSETLLQMSLIEKKEISAQLDKGEANQSIFEAYFNNSNLNLKVILEKMNKRLENLLSRDHTIGHSFLLGISTEINLYNAFYNKIIPLLQEYFFGDYGKIGLVLGSAFIEEVNGDADLFADFEYEDKDLLMEKKVYRINSFTTDIKSFIIAVKAI